MPFNGGSSISYDRYLQHKDYFDNGLINILEHQQNQIIKLKNIIEIHEANNFKRKSKIEKFAFKLKDQLILNYNLKNKLIISDDDAKEIIKEQDKKINELDKLIRDDLQDSYNKNNKLWDELQKQKDENNRLKKEIEKYKKLMNTNSTNSSKAPSTDIVPFKRTKSLREKSTKQVGGQPNHKANLSKISQKPNEVIEIKVSSVPKAAIAFYNNTGQIEYYYTQEIDASLITTIIETRYVIDKTAKVCEEATLNKYKINSVTYSDCFKSMVLYLVSKGAIALNRFCLIINELSNNKNNDNIITLQPGTIVNWQKEFKIKSQPVLNYLLDELLKSNLIYVDETGWRINAQKAWLHVMNSENIALFYCTNTRTGAVGGPIEYLKEYVGYLMHDHHMPYYSHLKKCKHVECNAHILRALNNGIDNERNFGCASLKKLFLDMLEEKNKLMENGIFNISEEKILRYEKEYLMIIDKTIEIFEMSEPERTGKYKPDYLALVNRLKKYKDEHLMFIRDFGVPFSNNAAERQIRGVKTKLKVSGQSKTLATANQYAAIHSINQTCILRNMNTLKAIEDIFNDNNPFDCFSFIQIIGE